MEDGDRHALCVGTILRAGTGMSLSNPVRQYNSFLATFTHYSEVRIAVTPTGSACLSVKIGKTYQNSVAPVYRCREAPEVGIWAVGVHKFISCKKNRSLLILKSS